MIKSLQKKFITIAMGSITAVLLIIIGGINLLNYMNVNESADARLKILCENKGSFPMDKSNGNSNDRPPENINPATGAPNMNPIENMNPTENMDPMGFNKPDYNKIHHSISAETPFDTRYFTVTLDSNGNVIANNIGRIAAISEDSALAYALEAFSRNKSGGFINQYKYARIQTNSDTMYIFLDCSRDLDAYYTFLKASILISILGLLLVFILVVIFSKIMLRPVAESYEKQKRFITDASHEIKTPLTIIDANTEILEMENGENEWTTSIRNQIRRLTSLTEKLVFLSRMDEEQSTLTMFDFSLSDAVSETVELFTSLATTKNKKITYEVEPNLTLNGNESSIRQLVSLLIDNAVKYTPEDETITLTLRSSGKNKILTVSNPAENLTPGRHDILFERFYRPDESRSSSTGGYGIGLSVAKAIVLAHKGKITAKSDDGKIIQFIVSLP